MHRSFPQMAFTLCIFQEYLKKKKDKKLYKLLAVITRVPFTFLVVLFS